MIIRVVPLPGPSPENISVDAGRTRPPDPGVYVPSLLNLALCSLLGLAAVAIWFVPASKYLILWVLLGLGPLLLAGLFQLAVRVPTPASLAGTGDSARTGPRFTLHSMFLAMTAMAVILAMSRAGVFLMLAAVCAATIGSILFFPPTLPWNRSAPDTPDACDTGFGIVDLGRRALWTAWSLGPVAYAGVDSMDANALSTSATCAWGALGALVVLASARFYFSG